MKPWVSFFVTGKPQPAGSKRAFVIKGTRRAIVTDANPKSRDWKIDVQHKAAEVWKGAPLTVPVKLQLLFWVRRPKGHFGTGKNAGKLKPDAPKFPASKPDVLKLARGVEDALTGICWVDDAQIVTEHLMKRYAYPEGPEGVSIDIAEETP